MLWFPIWWALETIYKMGFNPELVLFDDGGFRFRFTHPTFKLSQENFMMINKLLVKLVAIILVPAFLVGCYSKITKENYEKIQTGMTLEEVKTVLGEPTQSNTLGIGNLLSGTNAIWKDKETTITIQFLNDKVQLKTINEKK